MKFGNSILLFVFLCVNQSLYGNRPEANRPEALLFYGMDQSVNNSNIIIDATSNTIGTLNNTSNGTSNLIQGASSHSLTAWSFEETDNYISIAANSNTARLGNTHITNGITMGFWVSYNYYNNTNLSYLASLGTTFNILTTAEGIGFRFGDAYTNAVNSTLADNILNGSWQHITVTLDFSKNTNNLVMYLNGNPIHTANHSIIAPFHSTTDDLVIGAHTNGTYFFSGKLDDFVIFDEALNSTEVGQLYADGAYKFIDPNTYAYQPNSQPGGYDYAWESYTNDETTGLGSRPITFDYSGTNTISHAPPAGVHPRVFFSPEDIPEIRNRMDNTQSGQHIMGQIHAYTTLMHLGRDVYNWAQPYGQDPSGNQWIRNEGSYDNKPFYDKLLVGDSTIFSDPLFDYTRRSLLASILASEAYECLLYKGEYDSDTGRFYDDRAADLAEVMAFWAENVVDDPALGPANFDFATYSSTDMALVYDINYNAMTNDQRDVVRQALAKTIPAQPRYGKYGQSAYSLQSNWMALDGFEIIPNCNRGRRRL